MCLSVHPSVHLSGVHPHWVSGLTSTNLRQDVGSYCPFCGVSGSPVHSSSDSGSPHPPPALSAEGSSWAEAVHKFA